MHQGTPMTNAEPPAIPAGTASRGAAFSRQANAALVLATGEVFWGRGAGAIGQAVGEVCFNTSITGYQEIITDPSYAGQIITFTFPHIGNVGTNPEDLETTTPAVRGCVLRTDITEPASWRAHGEQGGHLDSWLKSQNLAAVTGVDTRRLTRLIRDSGAPTGVIVHAAPGEAIDVDALAAEAAAWPGLEGMDLAGDVTCAKTYSWDETEWALGKGFGKLKKPRFHVVAVDYGAKRNILRCLASAGCRVTVVPATATARDGGDGRLRRSGDQGRLGRRAAGIRDMPGPPDFGAGLGRPDIEDAHGPPRRQPAGQGPGNR